MSYPSQFSPPIRHIVHACGGVTPQETVLLICDLSSRELAIEFCQEIEAAGAHGNVAEIPDLGGHGAEPPDEIAAQMAKSDLTISLCRYSLAHSRARLNACDSTRFLSLPDFSRELLADPCIMVDYEEQSQYVRHFSDAFSNGQEVRVLTEAGTDITLNIDGRIGNYCPGFVRKPGDLGSPPDIEANVSPVETDSEGVAVIDGSITSSDIGLLETGVRLEIANGKVQSIESKNKKYVDLLEQKFGPVGSARRVLAECGVGLNPKARLSGHMLSDEGALGCVHFGFGSNHTVGGKNETDFHLDFVMTEPTLIIDSEPFIRGGELCLKR